MRREKGRKGERDGRCAFPGKAVDRIISIDRPSPEEDNESLFPPCPWHIFERMNDAFFNESDCIRSFERIDIDHKAVDEKRKVRAFEKKLWFLYSLEPKVFVLQVFFKTSVLGFAKNC